MILREFNNGWGDNFALRRFESEILQHYLRDWYQDPTSTVIINSTWYSEQYHQQVMSWLRQNPVERIVLCSFLDPAIPSPSWFQDLGVQIRCLGYYRGLDEIDAWALIMQRHFDCADVIGDAEQIDTAFLCLNRKPHWHRRRLVAALMSRELSHSGVITMGSTGDGTALCLPHDVEGCTLAPNAGVDQYGIANDIMSLGPRSIWNRCLLNVVTETVFDVDQQWFVSEKIYKPVVGLKPFLVYAPHGARHWLDHVGIENFMADFSDITDLDLSDPECMAPFLAVLSKQSVQYYRYKYQSLWDKLQHNRQQFWSHVAATQHKVYHT